MCETLQRESFKFLRLKYYNLKSNGRKPSLNQKGEAEGFNKYLEEYEK